MPWCHQPSTRCDVDHVVAFPAGPTCPCNLHPLCRRHHRTKQQRGWTVRRDRDGTTTWTTPSGTVVVRPPTPVLDAPVIVPDPADLEEHPPDPWPEDLMDPERFVVVDDDGDDENAWDDDALAALLDAGPPHVAVIRPVMAPPGHLDADHAALRAAVDAPATPAVPQAPADLGDPPF